LASAAPPFPATLPSPQCARAASAAWAAARCSLISSAASASARELVSVSRALVGGCGALLGLLRDYARSGRTVLYSSHVLGPCPATEISRCRAP